MRCHIIQGLVSAVLLFAPRCASYQIYDIWDRSSLFTYTDLSDPINFTSPSTIGSADIVVDDSVVYQDIYGFGGSLTDSSALLLYDLKNTDSTEYWDLLYYLFCPTDGEDAAGLSWIRVPLGASDFSSTVYSYDDTSGDITFADFDIDAAPSYVFTVLQDILTINDSNLTFIQPGWLKSSDTMLGGSLDDGYVSIYANYLLKCIQGFDDQGISIYAISIQNEPQNSDTTYPTALVTVDQEGVIGVALRELLDSNGYSSIKIIGYEHNWDDAGEYPVELMESYGSAFDGVSFHCYAVRASELAKFFRCSLEYFSTSGAMWNLALDGTGQPELSGSDSCSGGCRGIVQVNSNGTWSVNQEFYAMAQASKAILPRDVGGPWGQRINSTVGGELYWALRVGAYVTGRVSSTDWLRYSIVVLNWDDETDGWDPIPVEATIEFRDQQASYTFPVGVTTLWW
ncbi:glycoside hydrolase [Fistulina hepatica ATCC 64428]|uniref:Glycoside hydrolase n=1 Tax=Fistulina hepatica ATCC 64428 TaxID=1128425 RepID=A0A0D7ACP5_9AGAR|nr:glycoside hydrolase [Fistulina hepatica ATCC 64428]